MSTQLPFPGALFDIVVLAASAGGLRALSVILAALPSTFPGALLLVQHLNPIHRSHLVSILARRTPLPVEEAVTGVVVRPGRVYIAPPDWHLLLAPGRSLLLTHTAPVHFLRPAADLLFQSAADCCGERVLAVVLTGTGTDGKMGVTAVKQAGGTVLVEDPATAEFTGMPQAAIDTGCCDEILSLEAIAAALCQRVVAPREEDPRA